MGLRREYLDYIEQSVQATIGGIQGRRMLELGNQRIRRNSGVRERTGKALYTRLGAEHISLDFNGKDGAVALDLSALIDKPEWRGRFDIITNAGTTEHVEPHQAQFECFANLHNWLRTGGIQIHIVPAVEAGGTIAKRWQRHCNNYYTPEFFEVLASENNYQLVSSRVINGLRVACLRKLQDNEFMDDRARFLEHIIRKSGGIEYHGINDADRWRPRSILRRTLRKLGFKHAAPG